MTDQEEKFSVLVLRGGPGPEREVSLTSGRAVAAHDVRVLRRRHDLGGAVAGRAVPRGFPRQGSGPAAAMRHRQDGVVYSTEHGRMCPRCSQPVKQFIPIKSIKRISVMKQEIMIHL